MSTTAIVVNYNAGDLLDQCVAALLGGREKPLVKVLDNASTDGSAEHLRHLYSGHADVEFVFHPDNLGFARAVNACARNLRSEFLLIVNPDCRVTPDTLAQLRAALEADPGAALAAPLVRDARGRPEPANLRRFPDPWKSLMSVTGLWRLGRWWPAFEGVAVRGDRLPGETTRAEAVSGACVLLRRSALEEAGYLDEAYGLHCEDLDLMYRLHLGGWHCLFVPAAEATHIQGVSSRSRPLWVHRQKHLGMQRYFRKFVAQHHAAPVRWLVEGGIWAHFLLLWPVALLRR